MIWVIGIALVVLGCFSGVLLVGAPYLPTLRPQIKAAFELADLQPGQTMLELGCGDGRILIAAAEQGYQAIGYELNPIMAFIAWLRTRRYRRQIQVVWGDFWTAEWPEAAVIFPFLLDRYMERLDKKCMQYSTKPVKLVSYAFKVPGRRPVRQSKGVYLYRYT